ncbi:4-alpha-glucanotransferase [Flavisolibacter ginsengisoli]|jgi:4-alpha-glucanotransferase|uniref:4-alpha-glucanotransferase n=1 Tax=Flavisolibacter ginsengisoli DSM 18119 TaxID=1121884 RepID=A0A1M4X464_9BACT|nr:4-alpha-glucanotransferase [Flavisolibacter ginsengisoli]SHE88237.1 4-alpha-glucanotransferase [Flavisolibacter ginsengisoli DSM 18119]
MRIDFYLRFHTQFGQTISLVGNIPSLGLNDANKALPLTFFNEEFWHTSIEIDPEDYHTLHYRYVFTNEFGERKKEAEKERVIDLKKNHKDVVSFDTWNDESFYENAFFTAPFTDVFLSTPGGKKQKKVDTITHTIKIKAPLLGDHEAVFITGNAPAFNNWDIEKPLLLQKKGNWWTLETDLSGTIFPVAYKYGIYDLKKEAFVRFEEGDNRVLHYDIPADKRIVVHDGFLRVPNNTWKGSGIAIPVFSLRSANSFGVGEFADMKLLVDWARETGIKMVQILPVNDTSATYSWKDSYPYAAISAFALHPIYINLQKVGGKKHSHIIKALSKKQKQLNGLPEIDYEQVIQFKINVLKELFELDDMSFLKEKEYETFFADNKSWLIPYAAFCFLRDKYSTSDFSKWKTHSQYNKDEVERLTANKSKQFRFIAFYYFVQYHLHLQLKEATDYAHKKGIAVKGDIPIGIYRYGCDAWTAPELYNMDMQAGAPPDDFTIKGQNWGFPTYNWKKMEEDQFDWWRQRFHQMSNYFDAFRIDHILGFFRIWSIPVSSVEGILGRFIPALPIYVHEFGERGIWFDYDRLCKPYITDAFLQSVFSEHIEFVKDHFLTANEREGYDLKEDFDTQQKVDEYFALQDASDSNAFIRQGLFDLITNVILFEEPGSNQQRFHFRILVDSTYSFQQLNDSDRYKLKELYVDYFYRRQDEFWKKEALKKLPALKDATNMLICGEDLGMVPHSVPEVMQQLGILSLEIQRMPKNPQTEFFHPKDAPYLSVITPSSHDMSTIRGWWEENREKTQRFYNQILGEHGTAPYFCEPWVNRAVILQHLYSPAMWAVFQLQDILGMNEKLRREDPSEERINNPANPNHYWNYRMHIPLEQLIKEKDFNKELKDYITNSGR